MGAERESSFGVFVAAHRASLLRTALLLTGDRGLAEDIVQTALVRTFRHWRRVEHQEPLAYVRRAVVNGHVSWLRRRSSSEQVWDVYLCTVAACRSSSMANWPGSVSEARRTSPSAGPAATPSADAGRVGVGCPHQQMQRGRR